MAAKLTRFSKLLITVVILAAIFFGARYLLQNTQLGKDLQTQAGKVDSGSENGNGPFKQGASGKRDPNTLRVQLVTWGGYAPGLYFNEGAAANSRSRYSKEYGFNVDFILENDLQTALNAWMAGEYDVMVQTMDAFPLYTGPKEINDFAPKAFMQVDWSRGGDAIIVKRGINSVNDLKGKKIAVAVPSPAQTLLISSLEAAGLRYSDVTVIKTTDNLKAAELFRSNDIDAAVVWSPDDLLATSDVPGSKILLTTREQSHIIADIMFASQETINAKKDMIHGFYEGWMKGLAEIKANKTNREKSAKYLAELNGLTVEDALGMMDNVYWTSHGDNLNFFGLNRDYKGMKGEDLYSKMANKFVETGDLEGSVPPFRSTSYNVAVQSADANLTGQTYAAEGIKTFRPATEAEIKAPAIASKPISIRFESGKYNLSEDAKTIIDLQFGDVARTFANVRVKVEGNTDNVGGRQLNMNLSQKRAKAVADYLKNQYGLDANRFVIIGNGPDKPVAGCESNATEECKAKNRRTEFVLISN